MKSASVRLTLTVEQAGIAADLLEICKRRIPWLGDENLDERWSIAALLASHQRTRIDDTVARLRAALRRAR